MPTDLLPNRPHTHHVVERAGPLGRVSAPAEHPSE
jgi:hypothetical protein